MKNLKLLNELLTEIEKYREDYFFILKHYDCCYLDDYKKNCNKIFTVLNKIIKKYNPEADYKITFKPYNDKYNFYSMGLIFINNKAHGLHDFDMQNVNTLDDLIKQIDKNTKDYKKEIVLNSLNCLKVEYEKQVLTLELSKREFVGQIKKGGKI